MARGQPQRMDTSAGCIRPSLWLGGVPLFAVRFDVQWFARLLDWLGMEPILLRCPGECKKNDGSMPGRGRVFPTDAHEARNSHN
jgi:hypothetical protein